MNDDWFNEQAEAWAQEWEDERWTDHHSRTLTIHYKDGTQTVLPEINWTTVKIEGDVLVAFDAARNGVSRVWHFPIADIRYWIV